MRRVFGVEAVARVAVALIAVHVAMAAALLFRSAERLELDIKGPRVEVQHHPVHHGLGLEVLANRHFVEDEAEELTGERFAGIHSDGIDVHLTDCARHEDVIAVEMVVVRDASGLEDHAGAAGRVAGFRVRDVHDSGRGRTTERFVDFETEHRIAGCGLEEPHLRAVVCCAGCGSRLRGREAELDIPVAMAGVATMVMVVAGIVVLVAHAVLLGDTRRLVVRDGEAGIAVAVVGVQLAVTTALWVGSGVVICAARTEHEPGQQEGEQAGSSAKEAMEGGM